MSEPYGCWEPGLKHDRVHTDLPQTKEGPIAKLTRERNELAEALREFFCAWDDEATHDDTGEQLTAKHVRLNAAEERLRALLARHDAEKP